MKFADPYRLPEERTRSTILFASSQLLGKRELQEDYFINFNDECFAIADGVGGMSHGEVAARLACETAIWGYKHVRQRPFYWADKKLFLKRLFRTANMTVWQKRKEKGFEFGLATTLIIMIVGPRNIWLGNAGDSSAFLYRDGLIDKLTREDVDEVGLLTKVVGGERYGLVPQIAVEQFLHGDMVLLATDGVANYIEEDELRTILEGAGDTSESLSDTVIALLRAAERNGSTDNMTACLIKKIVQEKG